MHTRTPSATFTCTIVSLWQASRDFVLLEKNAECKPGEAFLSRVCPDTPICIEGVSRCKRSAAHYAVFSC